LLGLRRLDRPLVSSRPEGELMSALNQAEVENLRAAVLRLASVFRHRHRYGPLIDGEQLTTAMAMAIAAAVRVAADPHTAAADLLVAVGDLSGPLGAPADYGTASPRGMALRRVYDAFNAVMEEPASEQEDTEGQLG
jgi:hypothetical protein